MFSVKLIEIFEGLGGLERYIKPGMKVAIKPNLVAKRRPETAATTHPEIVYAVCKFQGCRCGSNYSESPAVYIMNSFKRCLSCMA